MKIDKRILKDSVFLKRLDLCELRLLKDGDCSWFILIPLKDNIIEWLDLCLDDQITLTKEIDFVCKKLKKFDKPDKINIGALGNMVPQLHIHIIARYKNDRAWPGAIWNTKSKKSYQDYMSEIWIKRF
jgi:diadenosine tetraphosphate (Ap4A) HIT family hydrolase